MLQKNIFILRPKIDGVTLLSSRRLLVKRLAGPAETVGQVGHLPYHFLVVNTGNDVLWLLSEIVK